MAGKQITVKVSTITGKIDVEAFGFKGGSCKEALKFLEETLGTVTDLHQKAEFFEVDLEATGCLDTHLCG